MDASCWREVHQNTCFAIKCHNKGGRGSYKAITVCPVKIRHFTRLRFRNTSWCDFYFCCLSLFLSLSLSLSLYLRLLGLLHGASTALVIPPSLHIEGHVCWSCRRPSFSTTLLAHHHVAMRVLRQHAVGFATLHALLLIILQVHKKTKQGGLKKPPLDMSNPNNHHHHWPECNDFQRFWKGLICPCHPMSRAHPFVHIARSVMAITIL